ncbi:MAG TPA: hypothetical protein PLK04_11005, partial [Bacillota bacterium]|nr:hypothetical protein [Bacillota bacterium]
MEDTRSDEVLKGISIGVPAGKLDVRAFVEEGSLLDLSVDPFFDDGILEFLERTDESSICPGNFIEGRYRV